MAKKKMVVNKKPHRMPLGSSISGFTVPTNKENAARAQRKTKKAARLKAKKLNNGQENS
jgi:hypothetical protein